MSSQRLEGEYGISVFAPPDRPEDPAKWKQKQHVDAALMKRYPWTAEQLATARTSLGFPKGRAFTTIPIGEWFVKSTIKTDEKDGLRWEESARACGLLK